MDAVTILIVASTFCLAGLVKGVTGMGLPSVAMGVLGATLGPLAAAALLLVPSFVTNVWQLLAGPSLANLLRRLWPMMAAIAFGALSGTAVPSGGDTRTTTAALGICLVLYATHTLFAQPFSVPPGAERWASPVVGLATGLVTGATGVFVVPAVPYLQSLGLPRDDLVQALGLSFTVSTMALGAGLGWHGGLSSGDLWASAAMVAPALVGMAAGQALRSRIGPTAFRRIFLLLLAFLGLEMATRAFR